MITCLRFYPILIFYTCTLILLSFCADQQPADPVTTASSGTPEQSNSEQSHDSPQPESTAGHTITLFFHQPAADRCETVSPVQRNIESNTGNYELVLQQLIHGPTGEERAAGYTTAIGQARVNSIRMDNGHMHVDFSDLPGGGSCRVLAIRAQIEKTLKNNFDVEEVIISVDGSAAEALQP